MIERRERDPIDIKEPAVVMLGTGTPNAEPDRSGPSTAIIVDDTPYVIDCGPGIVRKAQEASVKGFQQLRAENLNHLFLTHLHSDHTVGLPDLILTPWVLGRREKLKIFGPPGTRKMVKHIHKAWEEDIKVRRDGLESADRTGYRTVVKEVVGGPVYDDNNVVVSSFETMHGSWDHSLSYRFEIGGKVVCISGDCSPTERLTDNYRGCDVLIHEVYSSKGFKEKPKGWQRYHSRSHTSSKELGRMASIVKPKLLILTHQLMWGSKEEDIINDIRDRYDGEIAYAGDLDFFPL